MTEDPSRTAAPRLLVIDGPAGAGKSTVARRLAAYFGVPLLDTGAIYRALALAALRRGIPWSDGPALAGLAAALPIAFAPAGGEAGQRVLLGDEDVSQAIRAPRISDGASEVSEHPEVRAELLGIQRSLAAGGCVAEGRDMGTVVFPEARDKFFLTASLEARARRRHAELARAGAVADDAVDAVKEEVDRRDRRDRSRADAPLAQAADAVVLDSSNLEIAEVVRRIIAIVASRDGARQEARGEARGEAQTRGTDDREPRPIAVDGPRKTP